MKYNGKTAWKHPRLHHRIPTIITDNHDWTQKTSSIIFQYLYSSLKNGLAKFLNHEQRLDGCGHVTGGAQVLDSNVAGGRAACVILWPVIMAVTAVRICKKSLC